MADFDGLIWEYGFMAMGVIALASSAFALWLGSRPDARRSVVAWALALLTPVAAAQLYVFAAFLIAGGSLASPAGAIGYVNGTGLVFAALGLVAAAAAFLWRSAVHFDRIKSS